VTAAALRVAAGERVTDEHRARHSTAPRRLIHAPRQHQRRSSVVPLPRRRARPALRQHGQRRLRTHDRLTPVSRRGPLRYV